MNRPFYFTLALLVAISCAREVTPDADKSENKEYDEIEVYLTATRASVGEEPGSDVKTAVGEAVVEELRPVRERFDRYMGDKEYLLDVAAKGAEKASGIAGRTLTKVMKKVGFVLSK